MEAAARGALCQRSAHLYLHVSHGENETSAVTLRSFGRRRRALWSGQVRSGKEEEADLTLTLTLTEHLNPNLLLIALTETTMGWDPNLLTLTLTTTLTAKRDLGFVFSPWGFFPSCE